MRITEIHGFNWFSAAGDKLGPIKSTAFSALGFSLLLYPGPREGGARRQNLKKHNARGVWYFLNHTTVLPDMWRVILCSRRKDHTKKCWGH